MPARPRRVAKPRRTRLLQEDRRQQLIELGLQMFADRTYDDLSIDEVARAAGISKGLLYHYFPTKRDFYVAGLREAARRLLAATAIPAELPPAERVRRGLSAYLDYVGRHGPSYRALLRGGVGADPEVAAIVLQVRTQLVERMLEGMHVGGAPAPLLRTALVGWAGFVEAASLDWVERRDLDLAALCDLLLQVLMSTVARVIAR